MGTAGFGHSENHDFFFLDFVAAVRTLCRRVAVALVSALSVTACQSDCVTGCADADAGMVADAGPGEDAGFDGDAGPLECVLQTRTPPPGAFRLVNVPDCTTGLGAVTPFAPGATWVAAFGPFERDVTIERLLYVLAGPNMGPECHTNAEHFVGVFTGSSPLGLADSSPTFLAWQPVQLTSDSPVEQPVDVRLEADAFVPAGEEIFIAVALPERASAADPTACPLLCQNGPECNRDWASMGDGPTFSWHAFVISDIRANVVLEVTGTAH